MEQKDLISNDLQVTGVVSALLKEISRWARFLSIVGFILVGFMLIAAMVLPEMVAASRYSEMEGALIMDYTAKGFRINFIILAILMFFPCLYLFRFSVKMKEALSDIRQSSFEDAFQNLKSTFKFYGILAIILMAIYVIAFVGFILITLFSI